MAVTLLPDVEAITGTYLRAHADVAALVGTRVASRTPPDLATGWVRLTLIGDQPDQESSAHHLVTAYVQVEAYAGATRDGSQAAASRLARTVRAALHAMPAADHAGAVVTRVVFGPLSRIPDGDFEPARERYLFDAQITAHTAVEGGS